VSHRATVLERADWERNVPKLFTAIETARRAVA
jgi:hypothetical protein